MHNGKRVDTTHRPRSPTPQRNTEHPQRPLFGNLRCEIRFSRSLMFPLCIEHMFDMPSRHHRHVAGTPWRPSRIRRERLRGTGATRFPARPESDTTRPLLPTPAATGSHAYDETIGFVTRTTWSAKRRSSPATEAEAEGTTWAK